MASITSVNCLIETTPTKINNKLINEVSNRLNQLQELSTLYKLIKIINIILEMIILTQTKILLAALSIDSGVGIAFNTDGVNSNKIMVRYFIP